MVKMDSRVWPTPTSVGYNNGKLFLNSQGIKDGYFFASVNQRTSKRLKLRVRNGETTLTYDLRGDCEPELFPLQLGDGKYTVTLYEQTLGNRYTKVGAVTLKVSLANPDSPFLIPNQYVNYDERSELVTIADQLCSDKDGYGAYRAIRDYIRSNFVYDYVKALRVKPGSLPDINSAWKKRMGICQDLSAIMVAMLRTQGIPAQLVIGYADGQYHAWVVAQVDGRDILYDPTAALFAIRKIKKYTPERAY